MSKEVLLQYHHSDEPTLAARERRVADAVFPVPNVGWHKE